MVRIIKGDGTLVKKVDKHVFVLSVDVLQQGVAVRINASDVEKL